MKIPNTYEELMGENAPKGKLTRKQAIQRGKDCIDAVETAIGMMAAMVKRFESVEGKMPERAVQTNEKIKKSMAILVSYLRVMKHTQKELEAGTFMEGLPDE